VSRLGDGIAWYAMLATLPLALGPQALMPAAHMAVTALVGVLVYKALKHVLVRERPFASQPGVEAIAPPLDRYSFPSGHTLHAVCFLTLLANYFPMLALIMLPFGLSVAASRVILGLHYPSDVLAGALIGWSLARASLLLIGA
jgi:undecaprenyl-diphosphatase